MKRGFGAKQKQRVVINHYNISWLFLTHRATFRLNSDGFSRHSFCKNKKRKEKKNLIQNRFCVKANRLRWSSANYDKWSNLKMWYQSDQLQKTLSLNYFASLSCIYQLVGQVMIKLILEKKEFFKAKLI